MRFIGRGLWGLMALILMGFFNYPVMATDYPVKPITLIIPHPAGGSTDLTSRSLTHVAKRYLGQPIIIENKGGGGGIVGPTMVVNKPPDGYTIGVMAISSIIGWHIGKTTYNPIIDFTHIMTYSGYVNGLAVRSDSKWTTIQEFTDYSKKNPGKISCATPALDPPPIWLWKNWQLQLM